MDPAAAFRKRLGRWVRGQWQSAEPVRRGELYQHGWVACRSADRRSLRRGWDAAGAAGVPVAGGVERASDHLGGGLNDHAAGVDLALEEVQEGAELGRADGVGAAVPAGALVADMMEHELHPVGGL